MFDGNEICTPSVVSPEIIDLNLDLDSEYEAP